MKMLKDYSVSTGYFFDKFSLQKNICSSKKLILL